jgi:hypothetical protein
MAHEIKCVYYRQRDRCDLSKYFPFIRNLEIQDKILYFPGCEKNQSLSALTISLVLLNSDHVFEIKTATCHENSNRILFQCARCQQSSSFDA